MKTRELLQPFKLTFRPKRLPYNLRPVGCNIVASIIGYLSKQHVCQRLFLVTALFKTTSDNRFESRIIFKKSDYLGDIICVLANRPIKPQNA